MEDILKRAVRIVGEAGKIQGHSVSIYDASTGEIIPGIKTATVYIEAGKIMVADLARYETDEHGQVILSFPDRNATLQEEKALVLSLDVTALEPTRVKLGDDVSVVFRRVEDWPYAVVHIEQNGRFVNLSPRDALNLLEWLKSMKSDLEGWMGYGRQNG